MTAAIGILRRLKEELAQREALELPMQVVQRSLKALFQFRRRSGRPDLVGLRRGVLVDAA